MTTCACLLIPLTDQKLYTAHARPAAYSFAIAPSSYR